MFDTAPGPGFLEVLAAVLLGVVVASVGHRAFGLDLFFTAAAAVVVAFVADGYRRAT
ncbi:hypothetical protein [Halobaculum sp. MBLA0143]|uniref:hypothetical protein n=1 Tax=Halobaculum sp. MBLA0143 TaxID=3079933 RepID=UPI003526843F